jgi:fibronectin-binding autotransporter adhesin
MKLSPSSTPKNTMNTNQNILGKIPTSIRAAIVPLALLALAPMLSAQQTYTWSNAGGTHLWGDSTNWVGSPALTFNNQTDLIFNSANVTNPGNAVSIGAGAKTIRSLTINADYATSNNNTFDIRTNDTFSNTSTARNLTFAAASGNASITVAQSTTGTVQVRLGTNNFGNIVLNSNLDLAQHNTFFNAAAFAFDSSLTGTGAINKTGEGVVRLLRNNSGWSGNMNINEGAVRISNDASNAMGTGTWTLGGGGNNTTLIVTKSFNDNPYVNPGGIVVAAGAGNRTFANFAADAGIPILSGNITLNKDAIFDVELVTVGTGDRMTLSGNVTGTGGIVKTNTGILILSGTNNNYSGATDIQAGKLYLAGAGRLGSGNVTIASGANLDFAAGNSTTPNNVANNISGAGEIFQNVAGTTTRITGNVTNTGGLTINAGTFQIGNGTTTGSYNGNATVASGAALAFARSNAYTHGGTISGAGGVSKVSSGDVTLTGNNSYSGQTSLFAGALVADHANALGTGNITFSNLGGNTGTIRYTAASAGTDWATRIVNSAGTIRLDTNGNDVNLAGAINDTNTFGLVKSGAGVLTLGGNNTYTGTTTVSAGTLLINGSTASGSAVTVANGGTLGGTGTINGAITVNSGGTLSPGNSIGQLTVGSLTLNSGANLVFGLTSNATAGTTYDQIDGTSLILSGGTVNLTLNGIGVQSIALGNTFTLFTGSVTGFNTTTFNITNNTDWTGGWQVSEGSLMLTAIPEPTTWALLAGSLTVLVLLRRRRGTC